MEGMSLFQPTSIAVIGASATPGKVGHDILKNLLSQGYLGLVHPVNPKGGEILGKKVFTSVAEIPAPVDCAVIITPAPTVPGVLKECGERGIAAAIIISAGFKETATKEGKELEKEVKATAARYQIDLLGPNCLGMLRPGLGLNASFAKELPPRGPIALVSQSGAFAVALLDASPALNLGYSVVLSIGNKTTLDECDFLERCAKDGETHVIGLYLESINDGARFREVATRVAAQKPIVLLKGGTSHFGQRAAASHTGALAGSDAAINAVCAETGIRRAKSLEHFIDLLRVLSSQPPLQTPRVAIITNAGGPGILAADAAAAHKLQLPALAEGVEKTLKAALPPAASVKNPIDVLGDAPADRYSAAIDACINDPSVDGLCVLLTPQIMTPVAEIASVLAAASKRTSLMPIVASFMGGQSIEEGKKILAAAGIPCLETPERAVRSIAALRKRVTLSGAEERHSSHGFDSAHHDRAAEAQKLLAHHTGLVPEEAAAALLHLYEIPLPAQQLARSTEEAIAIAQQIGYPVILKISSPQILHKTDVGGIRGNIQNDADLEAAFTAIRENVAERAPDAVIRGILVQKFLPVGSEFIIGGLRDASFGPLVMAGLGGIYTELFRDTSFRLAPLTQDSAYAMLQELTAWKLLLGLRGKPPADIDRIARILVGLGHMLCECPRIRELDFNPVLLHDKDVTIADVKIVLGAE